MAMNNADFALKASGIKIDYLVLQHRYTSLKEFVLAAMRGKIRKAEKYSALKSVDFVLKPGETVGLIGRNGSGKSTLLKACAGILKPAAGHITRVGTLTSLIELGAGFDGELSAVENVYLSCMLMGFDRKKIAENVEKIFDFAELHEFRDFPVKSFSSGMHARLGFACATMIDADVILIDEVLAVGDEAFQLKCLRHMDALKKSGRSIIFVSHDLQTVQNFCDRVILLENGTVMFEGDPKRGVEKLRSVLLPEKYRGHIGDLSDGLKIQVDPMLPENPESYELNLKFMLRSDLSRFDWKFQIFGYGVSKPLLQFGSKDAEGLEGRRFLKKLEQSEYLAYELNFPTFPFRGGEFMSILSIADDGKELSHVASGFRFYPNRTIDHEEFGILNTDAVRGSH